MNQLERLYVSRICFVVVYCFWEINTVYYYCSLFSFSQFVRIFLIANLFVYGLTTGRESRISPL